MGNCKDCKHWEHHTDCYRKQWNTCGAVDWVDYADKMPEGGFALYADASDDTGLSAGLKTGPLFGCVRFKPKE